MHGISKKLIIDYLNLMYNRPHKWYMFSYTGPASHRPTKVLFIGKEPVLEAIYTHKIMIESRINFNDCETKYELNKEFKDSMFSVFGEVSNLKEIVIEWLIKKELYSSDIYYYENSNN